MHNVFIELTSVADDGPIHIRTDQIAAIGGTLLGGPESRIWLCGNSNPIVVKEDKEHIRNLINDPMAAYQ